MQPDVIGATATTAAIYEAEAPLKSARETRPAAVTILGGIHRTFMCPQVPAGAPWTDAVALGAGEQVPTDLVRCIDDGRWPAERDSMKRIAFTAADGTEQATPACPPIKEVDRLVAD